MLNREEPNACESAPMREWRRAPPRMTAVLRVTKLDVGGAVVRSARRPRECRLGASRQALTSTQSLARALVATANVSRSEHLLPPELKVGARYAADRSLEDGAPQPDWLFGGASSTVCPHSHLAYEFLSLLLVGLTMSFRRSLRRHRPPHRLSYRSATSYFLLMLFFADSITDRAVPLAQGGC